MKMALFFDQTLTGLVTGFGYAIVAVGLTYTLGLARIMNFAFGTFYMITAFLCLTVMNWLGVGYLAGALVAVLAVFALGFVFSHVVLLPALKVSEPAVMIASLGVGAALTSLAQLAFGADVSYIETPFLYRSYRVGATIVSQQSLILIVAAPAVAALLGLFMRRTLAGRRIRAVADAPDLASASGMHAPNTQALAASIGILLAGIAAVLASPNGVVSVFMGEEILLKAFTISALAGIGRIGGAFAVGLAVGVFESLFSGFVSTAYSTAAIYGLLIVTLLFFPRGIFRGH